MDIDFDEVIDDLEECITELNELMQIVYESNINEVTDDELTNDCHYIISKSFFFNTSEDAEDQIESCLHLLHDYILENPTEISEPDFEETMIEEVKELIHLQYNTFFWQMPDKELFDSELSEIIEYALSLFYIYFIPPRSYPDTFVFHFDKVEQTKQNGVDKVDQTKQTGVDKVDYTKLFNHLKQLKEMPQPKQRTKEWYAFRYNLITASNAYKAFEQSQSVQNQLIYEKCSAAKVVVDELEEEVFTDDAKIVTVKSKPNNSVNINSPMHWGQKYEPVSVMIYENNYNTKVGDYGCIRHPTYSFLGASPDGINDVIFDNGLGNALGNGQGNGRYGRMLEIKNIVNREIDGIPKKEYWIQMQLQMETCDLEECDFLETRFKEYEGEEEYLADEYNHENGDVDVDDDDEYAIRQGIIMYFADKDGIPFYVYKPLNMSHEYFTNTWQNEQMEQQEKDERYWIQNLFWKLEEYSCVLVLRNRQWFQDNINSLARLWQTVVKERETGEWTSRCPQKRESKEGKESKYKDKNKDKDKKEPEIKFCKETGKFMSV